MRGALVLLFAACGLAGKHGGAGHKHQTPACVEHPKTCTDLCASVGKFVGKNRNYVKDGRGWSWYYPAVQKYATCIRAEKWVEVGAAWGALAKHMLQHATIEAGGPIAEYHIVDPFLGGYDEKDPMSRMFRLAVANQSYENISIAWAQNIGWALGGGGEAAAGCRLRVHRETSVSGARLFADKSVDAVFIDGLHTYEGVKEDIIAWAPKVREGGSLIFNDYPNTVWFAGIKRAVDEEAARRGVSLRFINPKQHDNAVLGGDPNCAELAPPQAKRQGKKHAHGKKHGDA